MKERNVSQYRLAKDLQIPSTTINSWFRRSKGKRITPSYDNLKAVADYFGVTPEFLQYGSGNEIDGKPIVKLPVVKRMPKNGPDKEPDVIDEYICLPDTARGSCCLKVKDGAMSPQIERGSYVVFVPATQCSMNEVVIINNEWGDSVVRRYRIRDGVISYAADNPEYPSLTPAEGYYIVGRVTDIWIRREP